MKNCCHINGTLLEFKWGSADAYASFAQSTTPISDFTLSGNTSLNTDYRWRGQTQTQNDVALQANYLLNHSSGFYISIFGSNVDFQDSAHLELDPSVGYVLPLNLGQKEAKLDIGLLRYNYIGNSSLNYNEVYLKIILSDFIFNDSTFIPSISYTNDYSGTDVNNWYANIAYAVPIQTTNFTASANLGYSKADQAIYGGHPEKDFFDWKLGLGYNIKQYNIFAELAAIGTNLDDTNYSHIQKRGVETGLVFSLSKNF